MRQTGPQKLLSRSCNGGSWLLRSDRHHARKRTTSLIWKPRPILERDSVRPSKVISQEGFQMTRVPAQSRRAARVRAGAAFR
jgi:hypothetical protein